MHGCKTQPCTGTRQKLCCTRLLQLLVPTRVTQGVTNSQHAVAKQQHSTPQRHNHPSHISCSRRAAGFSAVSGPCPTRGLLCAEPPADKLPCCCSCCFSGVNNTPPALQSSAPAADRPEETLPAGEPTGAPPAADVAPPALCGLPDLARCGCCSCWSCCCCCSRCMPASC